MGQSFGKRRKAADEGYGTLRSNVALGTTGEYVGPQPYLFTWGCIPCVPRRKSRVALGTKCKCIDCMKASAELQESVLCLCVEAA